jgi:energy-coupling factor transport system ATP-binding protein
MARCSKRIGWDSLAERRRSSEDELTVPPVARVDDLRFAYGRSSRPALDGVTMTVEAGEVLLLEGPSGGGKSTLLRALAGLVPHFHGGRMTGRVEVGGLDTRRASPAQVARRAGLLFQDPEGQAVMGTVTRDVAFGPQNAGLPPSEIGRRVAWALEAAQASHLAGRRIGTLSAGERQRVALAGVLAGRPRLLLLDEPTSQLDEAAACALVAVIRDLADREGVAVVVAEHRVDRVRTAADRVLAVRDGGLAEPDRLAGATLPPAAAPPAGPPAATLEGVVAGFPDRPVLRGLDLRLAPGRMTALVGANGSGKSTVCRVLAGLHAPRAGRVLVGGRDVTAVAPERRFPAVGMVGQDPGRHLLCERVDEEVGYALRRLGVPGSERRARVAAALAALGLEGMADRHPLELSVGERERVALAAILVARPAVLVLDEPTRGMDAGRRAALAALARSRAQDGAAVLLATHDPVLAGVCDDRVSLDDGAEAREPAAVA